MGVFRDNNPFVCRQREDGIKHRVIRAVDRPAPVILLEERFCLFESFFGCFIRSRTAFLLDFLIRLRYPLC
jgi:hypothetical protein